MAVADTIFNKQYSILREKKQNQDNKSVYMLYSNEKKIALQTEKEVDS